MAENNEYVIRIVNETQSTAPEVGGAGGINADSGNSLGATNAGKSGNKTNKAAKALQGLFSAHTAVSMAKQAISFGVSQVQIETRYIRREQLSRALLRQESRAALLPRASLCSVRLSPRLPRFSLKWNLSPIKDGSKIFPETSPLKE